MNNEQKLLAMLIKVPSLTDEKNTSDNLFLNNEHKNIHNVVKSMFDNDQYVSIDTLKAKIGGTGEYIQFLGEQNVDMREFDAVLSIQQGSSFNSYLSNTINSLSGLMSDNYSTVEEKEMKVVEMMNDTLDKGVNANNDDGSFSFSQGVNDFIASLNKPKSQIKTGFRILDDYAPGMYDQGELTFIAGVSGSGKTTLAQNLMINAAFDSKKVGFLSLEMPKKQIMNRFISSIANVKQEKLIKGNLSSSDIENITNIDEEKMDAFNKNVIFFDKSCKVENVRSIIKNSKRKLGGLDVLFIDFIGILGTIKQKGGRVEEVEYVVNELKEIAKDMKVAIVALAQVNREATSGVNKRPGITHLKGSSALENLASLVIMVHREDIWNSDPNMPLKGVVEMYIKKNRHGPNNQLIIAKEDLEYSRFNEVSQNEQKDLEKKVFEYISKLK